MSKTILVLGASYAGLVITHKLLKHTLKDREDYKVVLVAPNTHHYWNLAAVRAIVPGQFADEKVFADIRPGFKQYPATKFSHILGTATSLDASSRTVEITKLNSSETLSQTYDILVICTGSRYEGETPWKNSLKGYEDTLERLHDVQKKVGAAKSIVIGGGGPTGVETAAELGFEYGQGKEVTLITGGTTLINPTVPTSVQSVAEKELKKLHVSIIYSTRVTSSEKLADGKEELTLSNGEKKVVDLYIPTSGVTNNTEFIPKQLLNEKGELKMDEFLRVKNAKDIWAAGDVIDLEASQAVFAGKQADHLAKNLDTVIKGGQPTAYKVQTPMIAVTLGRSRATGRIGSWKFPSLMVWFIKGRTIFTENLPGLVSGASA